MDDRRVGAGIRAARVRRGWRQRDLAEAARVSISTISRAERGFLGGVPIDTLRAIGAALEIGVDVRLRSRNGDVERLVNSRHAALAEAVIAWIQGFAGWFVRAELSFGVYGERGVIDLVAWHESSRTLVVIELKTEIIDVGETMATLDRKIRLAAAAVATLGWRPMRVGAALLIASSTTNRRRVAGHLGTFRSGLPDGIVALRSWLRAPAVAAPASLRSLAFFSDSRQRNVRSAWASPRRVRGAIGEGREHGIASGRRAAAPRSPGSPPKYPAVGIR